MSYVLLSYFTPCFHRAFLNICHMNLKTSYIGKSLANVYKCLQFCLCITFRTKCYSHWAFYFFLSICLSFFVSLFLSLINLLIHINKLIYIYLCICGLLELLHQTIKGVNLYFAAHLLPQKFGRTWIGLLTNSDTEECFWDSGQNGTFTSYIPYPCTFDCKIWSDRKKVIRFLLAYLPMQSTTLLCLWNAFHKLTVELNTQ